MAGFCINNIIKKISIQKVFVQAFTLHLVNCYTRAYNGGGDAVMTMKKVNTKIDDYKIRQHMHYSWLHYIVGFVVLMMGWWLVFDITQEVISNYDRVDVAMVGLMLDDKPLIAMCDELLQTQFDEEQWPGIRAMKFVNIQHDENEEGDGYYTNMKLLTSIMEREYDVFIVPIQQFNALAPQGAFLPLDDLMAEGRIALDGDVETITQMALDGLPDLYADKLNMVCTYGIYTDVLTDFYKTGYDPEGKILAIASTTENRSEGIELVQWLYDNFTGDYLEY